MARPRQGRGSAALVVLLAGLTAFGCDDTGETPVVADEAQEIEADNVVYGMSQVLTEEGVREARVRADTAYFFEDSSAVHLIGVDLTVFSEETGDERAAVTSERGRLDTRSRGMVGRGDVVLQIFEGNRTIRTEVLHYEPRTDRIWSDTFTVMEEAGRVTCGVSFRSDLEFRSVTIENARTTGCGG